MTTTIDTGKVKGRRELHFHTLNDIGADVEQLARAGEVRALGNWSAGQNLKHLAIVMNCCIDGFPSKLPAVLRFLLRLFMKKKVLTTSMGPGFKLPKGASALIPPTTTWEEGLQAIRQALQRQKTENARVPSPFLGPLTREEWDQLHCRHCELHLSFLVPRE